MSSHLSKKVKQTVKGGLIGWDVAIRDAENEIQKAKARIESLTLSVGNFKQFRDQGEPFPGEKRKAAKSEQGKAPSPAKNQLDRKE